MDYYSVYCRLLMIYLFSLITCWDVYSEDRLHQTLHLTQYEQHQPQFPLYTLSKIPTNDTNNNDTNNNNNQELLMGIVLMVTIAQSASNWRNTRTHVDSLTHFHQHSYHFVRSANSAFTEFG